MNYPMGMRAGVKLVSIGKVGREPDFATVGGFTVTDANGQEVLFDWCEYRGHVSFTEGGHLVLEFYLRDFDHEHFFGSNDGMTQPDWEAMLKGKIDEVYYEAGFIDQGSESDSIPMRLEAFELYDWDDTIADITYSFSQEQLDAYNKQDLPL